VEQQLDLGNSACPNVSIAISLVSITKRIHRTILLVGRLLLLYERHQQVWTGFRIGPEIPIEQKVLVSQHQVFVVLPC
jgi:hypothetical protein